MIARSTSLQGAFDPSELRVPYFPRSSRAAAGQWSATAGSSSRVAGSSRQRQAATAGQQQQAAEGSRQQQAATGSDSRAATAGSRGQQQQAATGSSRQQQGGVQQQQASAVPHQPREENEPLHCIVFVCAWLNLGDKHMTTAAPGVARAMVCRCKNSCTSLPEPTDPN